MLKGRWMLQRLPHLMTSGPGQVLTSWAGMEHQQFTKGQESIADTIQAGRCCGEEEGHEVTLALQAAQGKITLPC